jgi:hypothetical protein
MNETLNDDRLRRCAWVAPYPSLQRQGIEQPGFGTIEIRAKPYHVWIQKITLPTGIYGKSIR